MTEYKNAWDFYKDSDRLIAEGATLRELYDAILTVQDADMSKPDASPKRLRQLSEVWTQWPVYAPIRLAELFGGLEVEHTDDYILVLVGGLGGRREQAIRLHMLRHDDELRNDIFWRVFEVEGGGEISLANIDKFSAEALNWHNTVVLLANEGTLDRARVLRSCLEALNRDFSAYRAGWFSRVYAALEPTPAEAAANQDLLRLSLGSSVTATVSLAMKQLAAVHKAGLLEGAEFVEACGPALSGSKAAAMAVVRILVALGAAPVTDVDAISDALVLGLTHPHADVQRAAVAALTKLGRDDVVRENRDVLAPAVAATVSGAVADDVGDSPVLVQAIDEAVTLEPWSDDDALERFSVLLETLDGFEVELALAWLSASERVAEVLAPLAKRVAQIEEHRDAYWIAQLAVVALDPAVEYLPQRYWSSVTTVWNGDEVSMEYGEPEERPGEEDMSVLPSFITRLREVASILRGESARRSLLAMPTDTQGWITPAVFAARYRANRADAGALPADLTQALLRLQPVGRDEVLAALKLEMPPLTERIEIVWESRGSDTLKKNGEPQWVWWSASVRGEDLAEPSPTNPALVASLVSPQTRRGTTNLVTAEAAIAHPASTTSFTAIAVRVLDDAIGDEVVHEAPGVLAALAQHPGTWTAETAQLVALGMAGSRADLRAQAAEVFAAAVPARVSVGEAAAGFAACAPAVVLTRWAASFTDAASIAPGAVVDVLTALLPQLDQKTRGVGALLTVMLDESLRVGRAASNSILRDWLAGFAGSSAAAKAAKALLLLSGA